MTPPVQHPVTWLEAHGQRLGLVPTLGGGVAAWSLRRGDREEALWRPWDGRSEDRYRLASFAMLPWSNRISRGGFEQGGRQVPMAPNRAGEPYPIHGDGWLQPWALHTVSAAVAEMTLASRRHAGGPYEYDAVQRFELGERGLRQTVTVTHRGAAPLPYGLGLHPWFPRTPRGRIVAPVGGVWTCGADPIPTGHSTELPADWRLGDGAPMHGSFIDNGFSGWDGRATLHWPERRLALHLRMAPLLTPRGPRPPAYCLVYRPPDGEAFCFEPITQPIDAFHLPGRPGLVDLAEGESLVFDVHWQVDPDAAP
jgi:aldose 1-epimerase